MIAAEPRCFVAGCFQPAAAYPWIEAYACYEHYSAACQHCDPLNAYGTVEYCEPNPADPTCCICPDCREYDPLDLA